MNDFAEDTGATKQGKVDVGVEGLVERLQKKIRCA